MTKTCPIMSYRKEHYDEMFCQEEECALWDEVGGCCCFKTLALAAAAKPSVKTGIAAQACYIPPSSYCKTEAVSNKTIQIENTPFNTPYNLGEIL